MRKKSPKKFFKNKKEVRIERGSLRFWNLVARIVERDEKKFDQEVSDD